ncbi:MAG: hypothetical protein Q4P07_14045, partial [Ornithinimicrobium sp.]|uniref:hypothetical protein n=1 Tax=Ornithinimicrobium sp. TaxID=1977084 RepID=UPI0026DFFAD6
HDLRDTLCDGVVLGDPRSASDYLLVTSVEDGYPRTWRYDVGGGRVEVAVDASLDLLPDAEVKTSWATALAQELQALDESTVAVAAVRGTGDAAALRIRERQVEAAAARLTAQGTVVRGRQGDGFDLAVESGPHVEFVTVAPVVAD